MGRNAASVRLHCEKKGCVSAMQLAEGICTAGGLRDDNFGRVSLTGQPFYHAVTVYSDPSIYLARP